MDLGGGVAIEEDAGRTLATTGPAAAPETGAGTGGTRGGETGMEDDGIMRTTPIKFPSGAEDPGPEALETDLDPEEEIVLGLTVDVVLDPAGEIVQDLVEEIVPGLEQEMQTGRQIRRKEALQIPLFNRNCCNLHKVAGAEEAWV